MDRLIFKVISASFIICLLLSTIAYAQNLNDDGVADFVKQCCKSPKPFPKQLDPLSVLREFNPKHAELAESLGKMLSGEIAPELSQEELEILTEIGILSSSEEWILRPGSQISIPFGFSRRDISTWKQLVDDFSNNISMFNRRASWGYEAKFLPMSGRRVKIAPFSLDIEQQKPLDRRNPAYENINPPQWRSVSSELVWVKEVVYKLDLGNKRPLVITLAPRNYTQANRQFPIYRYFIRGSLPSDFYSIGEYVGSFSDQYIQSLLDGKADSLENKKDFLIGLIPFVGPAVELKNGNIAIGIVGLIGDVSLVGGIIADTCKAVKAAKCAYAAGVVADAGTVYLVVGKIKNDKGTALDAGVGSLASIKLIAAAFLKIKHLPALKEKVIRESRNLEELTPDNINCNRPELKTCDTSGTAPTCKEPKCVGPLEFRDKVAEKIPLEKIEGIPASRIPTPEVLSTLANKLGWIPGTRKILIKIGRPASDALEKCGIQHIALYHIDETGKWSIRNGGGFASKAIFSEDLSKFGKFDDGFFLVVDNLDVAEIERIYQKMKLGASGRTRFSTSVSCASDAVNTLQCRPPDLGRNAFCRNSFDDIVSDSLKLGDKTFAFKFYTTSNRSLETLRRELVSTDLKVVAGATPLVGLFVYTTVSIGIEPIVYNAAFNSELESLKKNQECLEFKKNNAEAAIITILSGHQEDFKKQE
jgi:hypothetical protein